ncbi:MAG: hypothetical protein RBS48_12570 [Ignavibacteriaceae bacterium]|jgi:hypothetical protein|nr:hypothetical protein [Ignavibacteriaceae bacterium]
MEKFNRQILHKNIVNTFIYGIVWGLLEIIAAALVNPNNIFINGLIFSFISVFILVFAKKSIDYKFSLIFVSIIALFIILPARGYSLTILIAIFSEALIAEIIFITLKFRLLTSIATGALLFLYSFIFGLISHSSLHSDYLVYFYKKIFSGILGHEYDANFYFVVSLCGMISLLIGSAVGWLSWQAAMRFEDKIITKIDLYFLAE